ncbi:unnamed protein product [Closterium sp. NIES-54]
MVRFAPLPHALCATAPLPCRPRRTCPAASAPCVPFCPARPVQPCLRLRTALPCASCSPAPSNCPARLRVALLCPPARSAALPASASHCPARPRVTLPCSPMRRATLPACASRCPAHRWIALPCPACHSYFCHCYHCTRRFPYRRCSHYFSPCATTIDCCRLSWPPSLF